MRDTMHIGTVGSDRRLMVSPAAVVALAAIPLVLNLTTFALRLPLGVPGRFVYLYSPDGIVARRLAAVWPCLALAATCGLSVYLTGSQHRVLRRIGLLLATVSVVGIGCWAYVAPPDYLNQHTFNMESPSQDGAFLLEAFKIDDLGSYLRQFPERAKLPPEKMRGTRVISNPPGTTAFFYGLRRLVESSPRLAGYLRQPFELDDPALAAFRDRAAVGRLACWLLIGLWLLAALPLYATGRLFFSPAPALAFCICALINPASLLFAPGKDPAQLLTAALPLWLWLLAVRQGRSLVAMIAGMLAAAATMVSLVHVWLAAAVLAATLAAWRGQELRRTVRTALVPGLIGLLAGVVLLKVACDMNVLAIAVSTVRAQAAVTRGPQAMPFYQQLLGLPLFALFAGSALWVASSWLVVRASGYKPAACSSREQELARLGGWLAACTAAVLAATVGFTNAETPRLWLPMVPLLLLAAYLRLAALLEGRRQAQAILVATHIAFAALQWALMDMREAEHRLLYGAFFW